MEGKGGRFEMMENIEVVTDFLWGPWTPYVLLFAGVLFTVWTRFTQYKAMTHGVQVIRGVYDDPDDPGAINHFQALAAALSATVGLGNIGGVALAIGVGGPGALFWMWIVGFLGMALKAVEITLAMMYRDTSDPENPHGGAMWVVDKVIGGKGGNWVPIARAIGTFFCITLIISAFTGGNMFQSWNVANLTHDYFGVPHVGTGIALALLVGAVIIGGIKRIGTVAAKLVPFMCLLYLACGLAVIAIHVADVPAMLALVVKSAFSPVEAGGAFIGGTMGFAFMQGMKRALFSNEAGQGSAPIAHAAAKTSEPAREGVVGGIGPFIDTICICTLTALVILTTGTWNRDAIG
ncbi:MAG TPA: sodium:alanine symporter family protein, partial [Planctomycetes bacterium]|nr:sodium:alanine symporter family protein [Planctomycetota bacterium]